MKRIGKRLHRVFSFAMGVILVVETINCAGLTAQASEGSANAAEVIVMDENLDDVVDAAEKADEAAYEAAQAAETAKEAAEALANAAGDAALEVTENEDGTESYTKEVTAEEGTVTEEPVLKEEIDEAITEAENKTATANDEIQTIEDTTEKSLEEIVDNAEADTANQQAIAEGAANAAAAAKEKAEEAANKAENAGDQIAAEKAAKEAAAAATEAQEAADTAKAAYEEAQRMLDAAMEAYDKAVADAELDAENSDAVKAAEEAIAAAEKALTDAENAVTEAKTNYDSAMADKATAQAAAEEAAKQAGIAEDAANQTIENLEEKKDADVESLKADKAAKEQELQEAKDAQVRIDAEQDEIIAKAEADKAAADAQIAEYNAAQSKMKDMEKGTGAFGLGDSQITAANKVAGKSTSDVKKTKWVRDGWKWKEVKIYYTQEEIDAAKAVVGEYNAAKDVVAAIDIEAQKNISATAGSDIAAAKEAKKEAAQAVTNKTTEISDITASIATIENYIYSDKETEVAYMDKAQQDAYQELLAQAGVTFGAYTEIKEDTEKYIEATKDVDWKDWLGGIFTGETWNKWFKELDLEAKYHGWTTQNGTFIVIKSDKDNTQALITIRDDKAYIATIDEAEFATYSATFDAVAASQAANKAAEAAAAEEAALNKYQAALAALDAAKERLKNAKINKLNIEEAKKALAIAEQNVEDTKIAWEEAQEAADAAQEAADNAKDAAEEKPAKARYYILNRGLLQPSEDPVKSYPAANYSKSYVTGELINGVEDENGFNTYSAIYKKGVAGAPVYDYLKVQPTVEQINQILGAGNELREGETITWYVIKTERDGYHVDGIISGQKFNVTVRYGYTDAETNEFIDLTESTTVSVGLGESYKIDSPVIDEYVASAAFVEGVATEDKEIRVEYTAEETRTVTINYYRGSTTGALLGVQNLEVAVSKVETYASTINTNWLNLKKPGDCYPGVMVSYVVTEDSAVANIVYAPIPVTPVEPEVEPTTPGYGGGTTDETAGAPGEGEVGNIVPPTEANPNPGTPVVINPVEPEENDDVETNIIEEEETPLAPAINDDEPIDDGSNGQETVTIEEEEAPLAAPGKCWIHWLILALTAVYTVYGLGRGVARSKKIKAAQGSANKVEA